MKKKYFVIILAVFFFGSIGTTAKYLYNSSQIAYNDKNVKTAIDELYDLASSTGTNARNKYFYKSYSGSSYTVNANSVLDLTGYSNYKSITLDNILIVVTDVRFSFSGWDWGAQSHSWAYNLNNYSYDASTGALNLNYPLNMSKGYNYASETIQIDVDVYIIDNGMKTTNLFKSYSGASYGANQNTVLDLKEYSNYSKLITDEIIVVPSNISFSFTGGSWSTNSHSWGYNDMEFIPSFRQNNGYLYLNYPLKRSPSLNYGSETFTMNVNIYIF